MAYRNLQHFIEDLRAFNAERNWAQFHSPKNIAICYMAEVCELADFFYPLTIAESLEMVQKRPRFYYMAEEEVADCFRNILLLYDVLGLTEASGRPLTLLCDLPPHRSPKEEAGELLQRACKLLQKFMWLTLEESRAIAQNPVEASKIHAGIQLNFNAVLQVAAAMRIDILRAAYMKHQEIAAKYPVNKARNSAAKYTEHAEKA